MRTNSIEPSARPMITRSFQEKTVLRNSRHEPSGLLAVRGNRMRSEADTCRRLVVPKLQASGWEDETHSIAEQRSITDGRIVPAGNGFRRKAPKRVDCLLRLTRDIPIAVVEAKASNKSAADGLQQAKQYAEMLGIPFAYATNGHAKTRSSADAVGD